MKNTLPMKQFLVRLTKTFTANLLRPVGLEIQFYRRSRRPTMESALERCKRRGTNVETFIDVGASDGRWTALAKRYFPESTFWLIEARGEHRDALERFKAGNERVDFKIMTAGDSFGEVYFENSATLFGGAASKTKQSQSYTKTNMDTIDNQVLGNHLKPPFAIKLDTHGFEIPILTGAAATLEETSLLILETYNFGITPDSLCFWEMCDALKNMGFRCIDMADPLYRDGDNAFWQMDIFFVPSADRAFGRNTFSL